MKAFSVSTGFATGIGEPSAAELQILANFLADAGESALGARLPAMIDKPAESYATLFQNTERGACLSRNASGRRKRVVPNRVNP